jgi:hypothetical protein
MRSRSLFTLVSLTSMAAFAPAGEPASNPLDAAPPAPGEVRHLAGEATPVQARWNGDFVEYRAGVVLTDAPLPEGYPRPTAPDAVELKRYPSVRRAEFAGDGSEPGAAMGARSMGAFWPLFQHIQRRDIPMTAPVEMDYMGMEDGKPEAWAMSFLYRTPDLGPTGADGRVRVYDTEPVTVISVGLRGDPDLNTLNRALERLDRWVVANPAWRSTDDVRTFGYNGPSVRRGDRWWEAQLVIEPATPADVEH